MSKARREINPRGAREAPEG